MNKGELVTAVSAQTKLNKQDIDLVLTTTIDTIVNAVASGQKVALVGFGTFEPRERKAREGRNPKTGDPIAIPATTSPAFSAGKPFKEKVAAAH